MGYTKLVDVMDKLNTLQGVIEGLERDAIYVLRGVRTCKRSLERTRKELAKDLAKMGNKAIGKVGKL